MNFFLNRKLKNRTKKSCSNQFFLESGLYQIYIEKSIFLAAPITEIVNQMLFVSQK